MQREKHWNACANRLYYACYYAVTALLARKELASSKHTGVKALFNHHFVKAGDVIIEIANERVEDIASLRKILAKKESGDKVKVKFMRDKKEKTLEIKLGTRKVKTKLKKSEFEIPEIELETAPDKRT